MAPSRERIRRHPVPYLREFRLLAGKTQGELAAEIGKSTGLISHLELGKASATEGVLVELAFSVGVEPEDLIG